MTPNQVVVLGGSGDIGSVIVRHLKNSGIRCISPSSKQVDLKNPIESKSFFSTINRPFELVFAALDRSVSNGESVSSMNLRMVENAISFSTPNSLIFLSSIDVYGNHQKIQLPRNQFLVETCLMDLKKLSLRGYFMIDLTQKFPS